MGTPFRDQSTELQQDGRDSATQRESELSCAASVLQSRYRGYRSKREAAGLNLETSNAASSDTAKATGAPPAAGQDNNSPISPRIRWNEAFHSGGLQSASKSQAQGQNDPASRWKRGGFYAERITGTDGRQELGEEKDGTAGTSSEKVKAMAPNKQMEAQYWLELVDSKHRYGTNLKPYHDAWNKSKTSQNFFYWLDHGEGKELDLDACSRQQLDNERVTYLNAEQRKNYLVDIGAKDGMLYWHRNERKVDTAKGKWEDLGSGRGVGYKGEKDNLPPPPDDAETSSSSTSSSNSSLYSSSDSEAEHDMAAASPHRGGKKHHYRTKPPKEEQSTRKYLTSRKALMDLLLRKTINSNTWIFVMTSKKELYVGIKSTGGFQHSSFMYGATVLAAGLLKVQNGQLTSLSPLSGHYRAGTTHFKALLEALEKRGVDLSRVSISKSLLVIGGLEKYGRFSKKKTKAKERVRAKLHLGPSKDEAKQEKEAERDAKIEEQARKDGPAKHSRPHSQDDASGSDTRSRGGNAIEANMHDGKSKAELTDEERAERAIALIRSAFSKGVKGERKKVEEDAKATDAKDTRAAQQPVPAVHEQAGGEHKERDHHAA